MIKKVLIANRGEIALRVIRACQELGVKTVAVYSDPDRDSLHVRYADEAVALHGNLGAETYLDFHKIFNAARSTGAEAIHPGYGFLSENASFAAACQQEGFIWIGPPAQVIQDMGDKVKARELMLEAGVPVVPGSEGAISDMAELKKLAQEIGFPVMIKAAAGGGGKGIRRVNSLDELESAFRQASGEAQASFGNAAVYLEKFVSPARHIEVQVLADTHGNALHLGERECSLQRRSQKLVEETPSTFVGDELRERMTSVSVAATKAIQYEGVGTFEFLVDADSNFYFLEMNTRLQVEHCVTEQVTGRDLVKEQILVASGETLSFTQQEVVLRGHSIELRVCCEDVFKNFTPSVGHVEDLQLPGGPHVRLDSSLYPGMEVTLFYDPMVAKLVVWAADRLKAIARMRNAVKEFHVMGVKTSLPTFLLLADDERFLKGDFHTGYLEQFMKEQQKGNAEREKEAALCAVVLEHLRKKTPKVGSIRPGQGDDWRRAGIVDALRKRLT